MSVEMCIRACVYVCGESLRVVHTIRFNDGQISIKISLKIIFFTFNYNRIGIECSIPKEIERK